MPQSVTIAAFVFGALLVLIALLGGNFKLFGAEISEKVKSLYLRITAGVLGFAFIGIGLLDPFSRTRTFEPTVTPAALATSVPTIKPTTTANSPTTVTNIPTKAPATPAKTTSPCSPTQVSPSSSTATTLLYSSLDDTTALTSPGIGQGGMPWKLLASDFVPGKVGNALAFVREGFRVTFPVSTGSGQNIDLNQGEAEFWYCPDYDSTTVTSPRTILFRVAIDASNPPALELGAGTNLSLTVTDAKWNSVGTASPYAAPLWKAGEWVHIRAVWNNTSETDSLQIYINGERVDQDRIAGNWSLGTDTARLKIHLGQADGFLIAHGLIDEFFIRR